MYLPNKHGSMLNGHYTLDKYGLQFILKLFHYFFLVVFSLAYIYISFIVDDAMYAFRKSCK